MANDIGTLFLFCERKYRFRRKLRFFFNDEIHLSYLFFSLTMQLTWTSASVLIAKYMLELFANVSA